jgi:hypothetical protein
MEVALRKCCPRLATPADQRLTVSADYRGHRHCRLGLISPCASTWHSRRCCGDGFFLVSKRKVWPVDKAEIASEYVINLVKD